jgi:LacI family transcriptional regulator
MTKGKSLTIAVVFSPTTKAGNDMLSGILRYASSRTDWVLRLIDPYSNEAGGERLDFPRPAGLITGNPDDVIPPEAIPANRRAMVCLHESRGRHALASTVFCDHLAVARAAAEHFRKRKFENFAFVEAPEREVFSRERCAEFIKEARRHGFACAHMPVDDRGFDGWLRKLRKPCAILAANDRVAKRTADTCNLIGIRIPDDVSLLGVDDEEMICSYTNPSLSSVTPSFEDGGYRAAELLERLMSGKVRTPQRLRYGVSGIVERKSTATSASGPSAPAEVQEFIRRHATSDITTTDAALAAGKDVAHIKRMYRQTFGHTICRGIQDAKLMAVERMLRKTSTPIDSVGKLCGFGNPLYLKTLFKRRHGMTMREFRNARS